MCFKILRKQTNHRLGKIFKNHISDNLYPELYKELLQLNNEIIITQLKKDLNRHLPNKIYEWLKST